MGKVLPIAVLSIGLGWFWYQYLTDIPIPTFSDEYWGPASKKGQKEDTSIRQFKISISDKVLKDLKARLTLETAADSARVTPPLEGIGFEYGFNTKYLQTVAKYWLEKYNWKAREALLNKYPQFKTTISGIEIHYQHVKSANNAKYKRTRPLLLLHGWPGSFIEFQNAIPLLTDPKNSDTNFELIIPSLPGFGFSEAAHRPGLGPVEAAQVFYKLMKRIGIEKYYVQGGDWGYIIGADMASLYPDNVLGFHSNFCASLTIKAFIKQFIAAIYPTLFMSPEEAKLSYPIMQFAAQTIEEMGYVHIQATKPDTVGVGLANSPTALLAYIVEKFSTWSNIENKYKANGGLEQHFKLDELLDNIMVYWVTNSATTAARIYSEFFSFRGLGHGVERVPITVPSACLQPPSESYGGHAKFILEDKYKNLKRYNIAARGGHFLALEEPELLATDLIAFIDGVEKEKSNPKASQ